MTHETKLSLAKKQQSEWNHYFIDYLLNTSTITSLTERDSSEVDLDLAIAIWK